MEIGMIGLGRMGANMALRILGAGSGEGRWTLKAAVDESVPAPVLATAISERFASRGEAAFANRLLTALRFEFGRHQEKRP